jgi:hypothetical protein
VTPSRIEPLRFSGSVLFPPPSPSPFSGAGEAQDLVAADQRHTRVRRVLVGAHDVEQHGGAQVGLTPGKLELLKGHAQTEAIDLGPALRGHDGHDLCGEAQLERSPRVFHAQVIRLFHQLVDPDLVELLKVQNILRERR